MPDDPPPRGSDATVALPPTPGANDDAGAARTVALRPATGDATAATVALGTGADARDVAPALAAGTSIGTGATSNDSGGARTLAEELRGVTVERLREASREHYDLLGEFARGGLGRIFRAVDKRSGRVVAIKEVLRASGDIVVRFAREALITANLQHPSIVPVYEVGRWPSGEPFFAMKLVRGRTLEQLIDEATDARARLALLPHVIDVAEALAYAHGEHVIHRDLKPGNVLVGAYGETVVIDWGLAKNLATGEEAAALPDRRGAADGETLLGAVLGTPAYMPPEQALGEPLDERADVYAIGAMLYQVLGGERPYADARTAHEILDRVIAGPPRPLTELAPELPPELVAIVGKAMAPRVADRYASAEGLAEDLRRFQAGQLVQAHHYTAWQRVQRWVRAHRAAVATAAVALVALAVLGGLSVQRITAERDEASRQRDRAETARGVAVEARAEAMAHLGDGLAELARQDADDPARALPRLAGALAARPDAPPALRLLTGFVEAAYRPLLASFDHPGQVQSTALSPDGRWAYAAVMDDALHAWDVATGTRRWSYPGALAVSLSPDGSTLLVALGGSLARLDAQTGVERDRTALDLPDGGQDIPMQMAWTRAGDRFAASTYTHYLLLGRAEAAVLTRLPGAHTARIRSIAFSPDGTHLASASDDGSIRIWGVGDAGFTAVAALGTPGVAVATVAWIDDARLIGADANGLATIWDAKAGRALRSVGHPGQALYAAWPSPDRTRLVTVPAGSEAGIWDLASGTRLATLGGHAMTVNDARWIDDRTLVTVDEPGTIRRWDADGALRGTLPKDGMVLTLALAGPRLLVAGAPPRARVWDLATPPPITPVRGHLGRIRRAFFADDTTLWTSSADGTAARFDLTSGTRTAMIGAAAPVPEPPWDGEGLPPRVPPPALRWLEAAPDGAHLVTAGEGGDVTIWDGRTLTPTWPLPAHPGPVFHARFSPDGKALVTACSDGKARIWDLASRSVRIEIVAGAPVWDARLSPDGATLFVSLQDESNRVLAFDARTGSARPAARLAINRLPDLMLDHRGQLVLTHPDAIRSFDPVRLEVTRELASTLTIGFDESRDGGTAIALTALGELIVFDGATGARRLTWPTGDEGIGFVALRGDGAVAATAVGRRVRLWDPALGLRIAELPLFPSQINQVRFSPDGTRLFVAGLGGHAWLWDVSPWIGDAAALRTRTACASPWVLSGSQLRAAPPSTGCAAVR